MGLSTEDKERLIENLDIEVANHRRRFELFLEQILEGFSLRLGNELTRIPKSIRLLKLKDFDAYGGNIPACVQAMAKQRIAQNDPEGHAKKRKWQAAILEAGQEDERASKTPRVAPPSPTKATPKANRARALVQKTPTRSTNIPTRSNLLAGSKRIPTPIKEVSPSKSRPTSPVKHGSSNNLTSTLHSSSQFKPASTTFNPVLPPKTPTYPRRHARQNESVMSVNGTPLALPRYEKYGDVDFSKDATKELRSGGFLIRTDPSSNPSYSMASTSTAVSSGSSAAVITVSTQHGQTIQFDPLTASPGALDRMPDLTDSAKKQVRDDTARIIQALGKWRL
ncbi:hypothetical protein CPB86DRAFT_782836 [Serendipita vermifera]|nr:hypothetical protein CPB86DRAFT_782836 [Serendipita vermifera]